eukprot:GGOE01043058.1.p1 GENE.GGOE01043058.1~~GGOE01043058.1.p1  ORF type:complete len:340 (-),score=28.31 GGOE01043058.1:96-1082(-)
MARTAVGLAAASALAAAFVWKDAGKRSGPVAHSGGYLASCNDEAAALFGHLPCYARHVAENARLAQHISRSDAAFLALLDFLPSAPPSAAAVEAAASTTDWSAFFSTVRPQYAQAVQTQECGCLPPHCRVATEFLSRSVTAAAALHRLGLGRQRSRRLRVHVLGAARMECVDPNRIFHELGCLFPNTELTVALVGPHATPSSVPEEVPHEPSHPKPHPAVLIERFVGPHHEYPLRDAADLVVAFHPGLQLYPEWIPTLQHLISCRIPTVITAFTATDMEANANFLLEANSRFPKPKVLWGPEPNAFHSLCALPPVVSNSHWMAFRGAA